jgi:ATP-binding cassette subfamily B protein
VLTVGGQQVIEGTLSYGELSAFLMYSLLTGFNAGSVASSYAEARRAAGASERVLALIGRHPPRGGDATLPAPRGALEMRDVGFAYPSRPSAPVLSSLSLTVRAGERVALLGASGCGKSTVASLLSGLYAQTAGSLHIDGVDLAALDSAHLRRDLVSVVPQEPVLLGGTLRENIALGNPDADEAELRAAAAAAGCEFAEAAWLREVGEQGMQLSGGQKQRVAIARMLLRDTPVVRQPKPPRVDNRQAAPPCGHLPYFGVPPSLFGRWSSTSSPRRSTRRPSGGWWPRCGSASASAPSSSSRTARPRSIW